MTVTKLFPSGGLEVMDVIGEQLERRVYFGFTRKEAKAQFRHDTKAARQAARRTRSLTTAY